MNNLKAIQRRYSKTADRGRPDSDSLKNLNHSIGYSDKEIKIAPEAAKLNLACGNPTAITSLKSGETVLDLGCGAGFDCFLAAAKVGPSGKVIGIDATPEMIKRAKDIATKNNHTNVDFRVGDIEELSIQDDQIDIVISNCVINLISNKTKVFKEVYRVLKPGGRIMISDLALKTEFPLIVKWVINFLSGGTSRIISKGNYVQIIKSESFINIKILEESEFPIDAWLINPKVKELFKRFAPSSVKQLASNVVSIKLYGKKPEG